MILLIIKICCICRHYIIKKGHMTIISITKDKINLILIDIDICTREILVLSKYRVISTKIYVWMYTPGAYHLPTSIILINHNASSSYIHTVGKGRISVSNRERVFCPFSFRLSFVYRFFSSLYQKIE
jgi:hypothetical protein